MLRLLFRSISLVFQCQFNLNAQLKTEYILPIKTENLMEQYLDLRETNQQFSRQRELIGFFQLLYCNRWLSRWTMWNRATERLERQACNCWNPSISSQSVWGKVNEYCCLLSKQLHEKHQQTEEQKFPSYPVFSVHMRRYTSTAAAICGAVSIGLTYARTTGCLSFKITPHSLANT